MIEKIDANKIQDPLEKSSSQSQSTGPVPNSNEDVSVHVNYALFIDKAMQIPQEDTEAVQRAKELLSSGQLESSLNVREAAENIIEFDI